MKNEVFDYFCAKRAYIKSDEYFKSENNFRVVYK